MRTESRAINAPRIVAGPSASAARTSARAVTDFEPGNTTRACTGPNATGAGHESEEERAFWTIGIRLVGWMGHPGDHVRKIRGSQ